MTNHISTTIILGGIIVTTCILLHAVPFLLLLGAVYFIHLATKTDNYTKENTKECKTGLKKKYDS